MPSFRMKVTDNASEKTTGLISQRLDAFNETITGSSHSRPLSVLLTDGDTDALLGGLVGHTSLGLLFVDYFFVPEEFRGEGLGAKMIEKAEGEAAQRGCTRALLYTIDFQAPDFYLGCGYELFGTIKPKGHQHSRLFFTKEL